MAIAVVRYTSTNATEDLGSLL
ncbi:cdebcecc-2ab5-4bd5-8cee-0f98380cd9cf [Thermothielavioides terrestris]|uniref:Cdebcecc-2ab5-4bd5-8cee-0f98380cd9cf n=1 Tax=Thermothielavioides terrestris TaxID=2587410 RepID=A0A3S4AU89_9PEZI|nr:cdebcecc-2ab5-4bd5-8cee-0f98380cd9cf [Thermothielavioides terrestris]